MLVGCCRTMGGCKPVSVLSRSCRGVCQARWYQINGRDLPVLVKFALRGDHHV
jgi:hypothetical protein